MAVTPDDLRFTTTEGVSPNGNFIFKLVKENDNGLPPVLIPKIDDPSWISKGQMPGMKQLLSGDLGITERVSAPIIKPVLPFFETPSNVSYGSNSLNSPETERALEIENEKKRVKNEKAGNFLGTGLNTTQQDFLKHAIPDNLGLKALEKTTITSFIENLKPFIEIFMILLESLAIVEDAIAMYLGTSIKLPKPVGYVGFASKNPYYTQGSLNYNMNNMKYVRKQAQNNADLFEKTGGMPADLPKNTDELKQPKFEDPRQKMYIGYFDQNGNNIDQNNNNSNQNDNQITYITPPKWVRESGQITTEEEELNKTFGRWAGQQDVLSKTFEQGKSDLLENYNSDLSQIDNEIDKTRDEFSNKIEETQNESEKKNLRNNRDDTIKQLKDIKTEVNNGINENLGQEYFTKVLGAQLMKNYNPELNSTAEKKENSNEVKFSTITINEQNVDIPIPLYYKDKNVNNLIDENDNDENDNLDFTVPQEDKVIKENYFSHDPDEDISPFFTNKIPENLKRYFLPLNYELVFEYEIRRVINEPDGTQKEGEVIKTEREVKNIKTDFENDYKIRLIQVINFPHISPETRNAKIRELKNLRSEAFEEARNNISNSLNSVLEPNEIRSFISNDDVLISELEERVQNNDFEDFNTALESRTELVFLSQELSEAKKDEFSVFLNQERPFYNLNDNEQTSETIIENIRFGDDALEVINNSDDLELLLSQRFFFNIPSESQTPLYDEFELDIARIQYSGENQPNPQRDANGMLFSDPDRQNIPEKDDEGIQKSPEWIGRDEDDDKIKSLMEGRIFQGVDPQYIDDEYFTTNKNKVFWLVEAIKLNKDDSFDFNGENINFNTSNQEENNKDDKSDGGGGKEWYGLMDKFRVVPMIVRRLMPLIGGKLIPKIMKLIKTFSSPTDILKLITEIAQTKINEHFGAFDKNAQSDFNNSDRTSQDARQFGGTGNLFFIPADGEPIHILDGKAIVKLFDSDKFTFGVAVQSGVITPIIGKDQANSEEIQALNDQPLFKFFLSLIKLPIEVLSQIIEWIVCWVKKLFNPAKMKSAIEDFLTFEWIINILSPSKSETSCGDKNISTGLLSILGLPEPDKILENAEKAKNEIKEINQDNAEEKIKNMIQSLKDIGGEELVEVFVYHVYYNGVFLRKEVETKPYTGGSDNQTNPPTDTGLDENIPPEDTQPPNRGTDDSNSDNIFGNFDESGGSNQQSNDPCGERIFDINKVLPVPFLLPFPLYNLCEFIQIFLKPLKIVVGIIKTAQEFINGFIAVPFGILGLEPALEPPELDIVSPLEEIVKTLEEKLQNVLI